ncbi:hypothetical protein IC797_05495 [Acinetobacter seifertii]|uniref:hypothetical protein n=1 Tax=Acinetobacter seifertii TaxID=1530123 RepID=UPI00168CCF11|nr:hypothetical protein [Acinetobacter seifertii]QNW97481.1 hypothetical protein IC797_14385 [Acinetobacter seifertii]QNW99049.1 hypothetical protein IC797_05495 [Acinetobacter seifertii]
MSKEYPKMLYKGDLVNFEYATAHSLDHEDELKGKGWVVHHELEQPIDDSNIKCADSISTTENGAVSNKEYETIVKKLAESEEQIAELKGEYIHKINELQKENATLKYSAMGANELKAILDKKAIKYGSRDEKDALVKLVIDSEYSNGDSV